MLDVDILKIRSDALQKIRNFFITRTYIELDTPALCPVLPSDADCELFSTAYDDPWTGEQKKVYLLPAHSYFLSKALAALKVPVFQISKCYRNGESADSRTSPEFTLLESCAPGMTGKEAQKLTEALLSSLLPDYPFKCLSLDEACREYAGFSPSRYKTAKKLGEKLKELGFKESASNRFSDWQEEELFELLLSQCIVPALPKESCLFITDWEPFKQQNWALYAAGMELAVSHQAVLEGERDENTTLELNVDRLIMLIAGKNSIENVIPFPFRLKKGYY